MALLLKLLLPTVMGIGSWHEPPVAAAEAGDLVGRRVGAVVVTGAEVTGALVVTGAKVPGALVGGVVVGAVGVPGMGVGIVVGINVGACD